MLEHFPFVDQVILFGSRAQGDAEPRSDIYVAVNCPMATKTEWISLCDNIQENLNTLLLIDLVWYGKASDELIKNIDREGRTLYERP